MIFGQLKKKCQYSQSEDYNRYLTFAVCVHLQVQYFNNEEGSVMVQTSPTKFLSCHKKDIVAQSCNCMICYDAEAIYY